MPAELLKAEVVEMICQRYHVTPSQALKEDVSILRHMAILDVARGGASAAAGPQESPAMADDLGLANVSFALEAS